ncbi:MAG: hypothetical protein JOZ15_14490 [Acidobacteria bacterium]|nr:hypothetical protein [Acidobacteriota bacterium]
MAQPAKPSNVLVLVLALALALPAAGSAAGAAPPAAAPPAEVPPPATGGPAHAEAPVPIRFAPGASSASLPVELPSEPAASAARFRVAGRAGQVLEVSVRFPVKDPAVALTVTCAGGGHTGIGRFGRLEGSVSMPQTGDYDISISKLAPSPLPPGVLTVAVTGAPRLIAARPYTGTYYRDDGSQSSVDVREIGNGKVQFSLLAFAGDPDSPYGPNLGEARGVVALGGAGAGVFEQAGCRLALRFGAHGSGSLHVDESGDCGFGHNVTARGDYHRTSLCAAPAAQQ